MGVQTQFYEDIVAIGGGEEGRIKDDAIVYSLNNYLNRMQDAESLRLKKCFFAILIHGWANSVSPSSQDGKTWYKGEFVEQICKYHRWFGKNRGVLLASCVTGYGLADDIAKALKLPVVAPQALGYITASGKLGVVKIPPKYGIGEGNLRWIIATPDGAIDEISQLFLDKTIACQKAAKWLPPSLRN